MGGLGKRLKEKREGLQMVGMQIICSGNPAQSYNEIFGKLLNVLLIEVKKDPRFLFPMFLELLFPFLKSSGHGRRLG